jgi:hypothetical protein
LTNSVTVKNVKKVKIDESYLFNFLNSF